MEVAEIPKSTEHFAVVADDCYRDIALMLPDLRIKEAPSLSDVVPAFHDVQSSAANDDSGDCCVRHFEALNS
ncbi:hypothetical protein [Burkholderia mayonis]|uniref:hypothetical protein n=1 Tax=Burkholderia mayonis TaxID=1385591 RepID=UPI000A893EF8|nr:hypothetical protein [Burkholderia mayonis]